jgi:hypothetical protein
MVYRGSAAGGVVRQCGGVRCDDEGQGKSENAWAKRACRLFFGHPRDTDDISFHETTITSPVQFIRRAGRIIGGC